MLGRPHPAEPASLVPNLRRLANELGLGNHVRFVDHYLTEEEIQRYLAATDVYLAPYRDLSQTSSGTLTRALAAGRTAVATISTSRSVPRKRYLDARGQGAWRDKPERMAIYRHRKSPLRSDYQMQRFCDVERSCHAYLKVISLQDDVLNRACVNADSPSILSIDEGVSIAWSR